MMGIPEFAWMGNADEGLRRFAGNPFFDQHCAKAKKIGGGRRTEDAQRTER